MPGPFYHENGISLLGLRVGSIVISTSSTGIPLLATFILPTETANRL